MLCMCILLFFAFVFLSCCALSTLGHHTNPVITVKSNNTISRIKALYTYKILYLCYFMDEIFDFAEGEKKTT